ncbi:hypothetical protein Igag_0765 [Ignisphaera aggregans DSM 17230]|uniref:Uncharacterized protein n=1 Tax=Ignisphaera aggregans (strain DSM 17230 / JCM 13409 / AQ1.S1) TaxID=583356 RepID=E0STB5_IGNAA|nr:hypothetical protein Igag_0765 [Ignisphaera aggregans DSM 17230]
MDIGRKIWVFALIIAVLISSWLYIWLYSSSAEKAQPAPAPRIILRVSPIDVSIASEADLTRVVLYVVNNLNRTLRIVDSGWHIDVYNLSWNLIGSCNLSALEIREISVDPGRRGLLRSFDVVYRDSVLYIDGVICIGRLDPGRYIVRFRLDSDPQIYTAISMDMGSRYYGVWRSDDAAIDIVVEYVVETDVETIERYIKETERYDPLARNKTISLEDFRNPAILRTRISVINIGRSIVVFSGTGCGCSTFASLSVVSVEEGKYRGLCPLTICLILCYKPLTPGSSAVDETRYLGCGVLIVDRPFRATLRIGIEALYNCSWWHWTQCTNSTYIAMDIPIKID